MSRSPSRSGTVWHLAAALTVAAVAGCGPAMVKAHGTVLKNGAPIKSGQAVIVFYPYTEGAEKPPDFFQADIMGGGKFRALGKNGRGIPPGKYRIAVDSEKGDLGNHKSPIVREITTASEEIVIDIGKMPQ